ncbi:hypothetical protein SLEP1_g20972 [Rubroshorea leprosula]|uniref:Uncharacterized protein n=1 Tax=Rubroshorea leprosula TaxID=152421 RepID=A0AAV5JD94_9ROSI|nr:hypothetical protein SLEP1_g20972 [Rubroshorea leprosula]
MVSLIRSKARSVVSSMAAYGSSPTPYPLSRFSALPNPFSGFPRIWVASNQIRLAEVKDTQLGVEEEFTSFKEQQYVPKSGAGMNMFDELKQRFLSFKKHKYL